MQICASRPAHVGGSFGPIEYDRSQCLQRGSSHLDASCAAAATSSRGYRGSDLSASDGLAFLALGPHHPGDGEQVDDMWVS